MAAPTVDVDKNETGMVPVWLVGICAWTVEPDPDNVTAPVTAAPNVDVVAKLTGMVDVVDIETPMVDVVANETGNVEVVDKTAVPPIFTVPPVAFIQSDGVIDAPIVEVVGILTPTVPVVLASKTAIVDVVVTAWVGI
jgi:hypothetical protein